VPKAEEAKKRKAIKEEQVTRSLADGHQVELNRT
jgi:hypothetical protein